MRWTTLLLPLILWGCSTDEPDPGELSGGSDPEYAYIVIENGDPDTALRVFGEEYVAPGKSSKPYEALKGEDRVIWYNWNDKPDVIDRVTLNIPWSDLSVGKTKTITATK